MRPSVPIAVIDDQDLFRNALCDMIGLLGGYKVVLQAGNGHEYQELIADGTNVSVAIVDLHMPVMDGYETIAWIRANQPETRTLALTFDNDEQTMVRALRCGACGFLPKNVNKGIFREALAQVVHLGHYINEDLVERGQVASHSTHEEARGRVITQLSHREVEFIRQVCDESEPTYEQIAARMGVSMSTVQGYRHNIFTRHSLKSKAGLVIFAYKWNLL